MVTLCTPAVKADVWYVAAPLLNVPVPSVVVPSWNVTVPVGVPPDPVTFPVKVTAVPTTTVAADVVTADVVLALVIGVVWLLEPPHPTKNSDIARARAISTPQRSRFLLKLPARIIPNIPIPVRLANSMEELPGRGLG